MRDKGVHLAATDRFDGGPDHGLPEIALAGRSNVGKSSLLNALVGARAARTSKTPGRTQLLHLYRFERAAVLVDLPGVGYAKAPVAVRRRLEALVKRTVEERSTLVALLLLVDLRREPGDAEAALLDRAARRGLPAVLVATKADKLSRSRVKPALARLAGAVGVPTADVLGVSALKRVGLDQLRDRLRALAG